MTFPLARGILTGMADTTSKPRWYCPTPGWLVVLLLATTGFLYLSERFQWFSFNSHTGWTVLLAVASVGVVLLLMLPWLVAALIVRWRFQFSIRSLLLLVVAVALPFSWLAVEMKKARDNKKALNEIQSVGGSFAYQLVWPEWVRRFVGDDDYFFEVLRVTVGAGRPGGASLPRMDDDQFRALMPALRQFPRLIHLDVGGAEITDRVVDDITTLTNVETLDLGAESITDDALSRLHSLPRLKFLRLGGTGVTDAGLPRLAELTRLQWLELSYTKVTDGGLERLVGLNQLHELHLEGTHVTDGAVAKLQRALPNCKIYH